MKRAVEQRLSLVTKEGWTKPEAQVAPAAAAAAVRKKTRDAFIVSTEWTL
jgi:hypothetical protein